MGTLHEILFCVGNGYRWRGDSRVMIPYKTVITFQDVLWSTARSLFYASVWTQSWSSWKYNAIDSEFQSFKFTWKRNLESGSGTRREWNIPQPLHGQKFCSAN